MTLLCTSLPEVEKTKLVFEHLAFGYVDYHAHFHYNYTIQLTLDNLQFLGYFVRPNYKSFVKTTYS